MKLCLDRALKIDGWMSETELQFLAEVAGGSKLIYEIGSFIGRSTRAIADNTQGIVHAIDSWKADNFSGDGNGLIFKTNEDTFNMFYCNMHDLIDSKKVIPSFCNWEDFYTLDKADFIFIDGDHRYESVRRDIDKALEYIQTNGIIAGHDYALPWPGVIKAVNETFSEPHLIDSIWWVQMI